MNRHLLLSGAVVLALTASAVHAAEPAKTAAPAKTQVAAGETHEQQCARWASYQKLQGSAQTQYIKDCTLDLRVPDKKDEGGGD